MDLEPANLNTPPKLPHGVQRQSSIIRQLLHSEFDLVEIQLFAWLKPLASPRIWIPFFRNRPFFRRLWLNANRALFLRRFCLSGRRTLL